CVVERESVQTHFALLEHALVVLEDVFDRVLERNDVLLEVGVDVLDHGRQGGGFAATGRSSQQYDAARGFRDFLDLLQEAQFLEAGHMRFYIAHGQTPLAALLEEVRPETPNAWDEVGEVRLALLLDPLF